jgi:hypothetical protein
MPTNPNRTALQTPLLTLALVLAQSGSVLAQALSPSALMPVSAGLSLANPAESAPLKALPSAPVNTSTAAGEPLLAANSVAMAPAAFVPVTAEPTVSAPHRFWDRENLALFATVGVFATADFCTTRTNLASGGKELNPVTRVFSGSTPGLAANFVLETAGVMAVSYVFHKTRHHKLERITSFANLGSSATAVAYGLTHR